jgi:polyisoprenoid-binding protein YceI
MKTTIKLLAVALVTAVIAVSCGSGSDTETNQISQAKDVAEMTGGVYSVDTEASIINWKGEKFNGDFHIGTISVKEGTLSVEDGAITGGNFTIDMNSIEVTDETPDDKKAYLTAHLKGTSKSDIDGDFFQVTKYPTASFEITGVEGNEISGNLTMLDSTHNVTFTATTSIEDGVLTATTDKFTFDRTQWGIVFMSTITGFVKEKALKNEIEISIKLTANAAGEATEGEATEEEATKE